MPALTLELGLDPADAARLIKLAGGGRARTTALRIVWHDAPGGTLASQGFSLAEKTLGRETSWRLERIHPAPDAFWPPGAPAQLIRAANALAELGGSAGLGLPDAPMAMVTFTGQVRETPMREGVEVRILSGELRSLTNTRPACRATLSGESAAVGDLAIQLADKMSVSIPSASLCAEAFATAGVAPPPRRLGAPTLPGGCSVDEAFAHIVAHLLDVILHHAARATPGGSAEPVHQMRVAVRRLRSAFGLFKEATRCAAVETARADLRTFAAVLGPARDWDVFTRETCPRALAAFPDEKALARVAAQAERKRAEAYQALEHYLAGATFRLLGIRLTLLAATRPWRDAAAVGEPGDLGDEMPELAPPAETDLAAFAARVLSKRLKRVLSAGEDVADLPTDALHAIRLDGKRLRYAAEFFAPLFPHRGARAFLKRMTHLQERLGQLNDGSVAAGLMSEIGHARSYAGGLMRGLVAAGGGRNAHEDRSELEAVPQTRPFLEVKQATAASSRVAGAPSNMLLQRVFSSVSLL